jgi:hypothetical protein
MTYQRFSHFARRTDQDTEHWARQPRRVKQFGKLESRERCFFRWLQHQRRARGNGGRDLVRDLIEWMVEGRDRGGATQWLACREDFSGFALGRDVRRKNLAVVPQRFHRRAAQHLHGPADLITRFPQTASPLSLVIRRAKSSR